MRNWVILPLSLLLTFLLTACNSENTGRLAIGDSAPSFSLPSMSGGTISLAEMKGSPVLIRFFLTDCKYCRADTPVFNDFYAKYHEQGLQVLYIDSLGIDAKLVQSFARELGIVFPVMQDKGGKVSASYMVRALPQTIVLDPDHKIIAAILGGVSEDELTKLLSPYFSQ